MRKPLLDPELCGVVNGVGNGRGVAREAGELREGNMKFVSGIPELRNHLLREAAQWVGNVGSERIGDLHGGQHRGVRTWIACQTRLLIVWAEEVQVTETAEVEMGPLLSNVVHLGDDLGRQFFLDAKAPRLFVRDVPADPRDGPRRAKSYVVQHAQRVAYARLGAKIRIRRLERAEGIAHP